MLQLCENRDPILNDDSFNAHPLVRGVLAVLEDEFPRRSWKLHVSVGSIVYFMVKSKAVVGLHVPSGKVWAVMDSQEINLYEPDSIERLVCLVKQLSSKRRGGVRAR